MKLHEALPQYFTDRASAIRSEGTRRRVRLALRLLDRHVHGRHLEKVTGDDLVSFLSSNQSWSTATVANYRSILVPFFDWAAWKGLTALNPASAVRHLVKVRVQPVRAHNWLTPEQAGTVLATCRDGSLLGQRDEALILLGLYTGLRASEIAGLRWGAVDLPGGSVTVLGKGGKLAQQGLAKPVIEALFSWRGECAKGLGRPPAGHDPVFPRAHRDFEGGTSIAWTSAGKETLPRVVVKRRGELAGIPSLRPHDLRRSFAGWVEAQHGIFEASRLLRHSNVGTTQAYLEKNPRRVIEQGQSLDFGLG